MVETKERQEDKTLETAKPPKNHVTPHDWFFSECISYPEAIRGLIERYLPREDLRGMQLNTIKLENPDFIDQILGEKACDLLFSVLRNKQKSYIYVLTEHQSSVDHTMLNRILKYMSCIYDMHKVQHPESKKLPLILPILVYSGTRKYTAPLSIQEASEDPERAKYHFPLSPMRIIDLQQAKDSDIELHQNHYLEFALFLLKNIRSKNICERLREIDSIIKLLKKEDRGLHFLGRGLYYSMTMHQGVKKGDELKQIFTENTSIENKGKIMSIIDHIKKEERTIGIEQGIELGAEQQTQFIVNNMLKKHLSVSDISSMTGLCLAEIEKLKENLR